MNNIQKFHARPSLVPPWRWRLFPRSIHLGLAAALALALPASADNLSALNQLAETESGVSAVQAFGGTTTIIGVPISQFTALTPSQLQQALNTGIAEGLGNNFGKGTAGINILAGAHPISLADAAALQAAYASDHNVAELLARAYAAAGINLQKAFSSIFVPVGPGSPEPVQSGQVFHKIVLDQIKTVDEEQAAAAGKEGKFTILGLHPMVESSAFYEQADLKRQI
jgi:hypothetical protein